MLHYYVLGEDDSIFETSDNNYQSSNSIFLHEDTSHSSLQENDFKPPEIDNV